MVFLYLYTHIYVVDHERTSSLEPVPNPIYSQCPCRPCAFLFFICSSLFLFFFLFLLYPFTSYRRPLSLVQEYRRVVPLTFSICDTRYYGDILAFRVSVFLYLYIIYTTSVLLVQLFRMTCTENVRAYCA